jgi:hydroxymethylbilane synthase
MTVRPNLLRIATRRSPLAVWQARWVAARLEQAGCSTELVLMSSQGDEDLRPIGAASSVGLFTKRIQESVLASHADLAVHSLKDLPTEPCPGLHVCAIPQRGDPRDALVSHAGHRLDELPQGARIGTGSRRRVAQLLWCRPDLVVESIRGNVVTRLSKLDGELPLAAVVLACAGLQRLELTDVSHRLVPLGIEWMLPAPGQGALAIECRAEEASVAQWVRGVLNDRATEQAVVAERGLLRALRGGCLAPIGSHAQVDGDRLKLLGVVLSVDGRQRLFSESSGPAAEAAEIGQRLADKLLADGAAEILATAR